MVRIHSPLLETGRTHLRSAQFFYARSAKDSTGSGFEPLTSEPRSGVTEVGGSPQHRRRRLKKANSITCERAGHARPQSTPRYSKLGGPICGPPSFFMRVARKTRRGVDLNHGPPSRAAALRRFVVRRKIAEGDLNKAHSFMRKRGRLARTQSTARSPPRQTAPIATRGLTASPPAAVPVVAARRSRRGCHRDRRRRGKTAEAGWSGCRGKQLNDSLNCS